MKRRLVQTAFPVIVLFALCALSSESLAGASLAAPASAKPHIRASKSAVPADSTGTSSSPAERVPSPADVLGFKPGDDRKLAGWSQIVSYFKRLGSSSPRVSVQESGLTTERRPFIYAVISSEDNIRNLAAIREAQRKLADPRLISSDEERDRLIRDTPAVVAITCSIHSTEIGASQMSMELAYRLASDDSPRTRQILSNVVLLLVPSVNPDGIDIVTDWYRKTLNTKYEG
ncbi:MAG: M14 family zinc carboxypeptidase, partial [Blastocatellia bacterium]